MGFQLSTSTGGFTGFVHQQYISVYWISKYCWWFRNPPSAYGSINSRWSTFSPPMGSPFNLNTMSPKCKKEGTSKQQKPGTSHKSGKENTYPCLQNNPRRPQRERNPLVTKHRDRMFPGHTRKLVKNMTGSTDSLMCLHHLVELTGIFWLAKIKESENYIEKMKNKSY